MMVKVYMSNSFMLREKLPSENFSKTKILSQMRSPQRMELDTTGLWMATIQCCIKKQE